MKPTWLEIYARQARISELERAAETSRAEHAAVVAELASVREHALPLCPTPYTGPATGIDLVDRLRGIYVVPVVGERRFDASAINLEAAAALGLATARIRELEGERDELLGLVMAPDAGDDCRPRATEIHEECGPSNSCWEHRRRAIVARIEKATKGTR